MDHDESLDELLLEWREIHGEKDEEREESVLQSIADQLLADYEL